MWKVMKQDYEMSWEAEMINLFKEEVAADTWIENNSEQYNDNGQFLFTEELV